MAWGRVIRKGFREEVKPILSPGKRRNRKMEEECLGRGKSTEKNTKAWNNLASSENTQQCRVLGERSEVRVLGQGQRMRTSCVWMLPGRHNLGKAFASLIGGVFGVYSDMDTEGDGGENTASWGLRHRTTVIISVILVSLLPLLPLRFLISDLEMMSNGNA